MGKMMHPLQHKFFGAIVDMAFRYLDKNPQRNMLKLVNVAEKLTGKMFPPSTYVNARRIVEDEKNVWHQYLMSALEEIDHNVLRKAGLVFGLDFAYYGTKTVRANREKYKCNIPAIILLDPTSACNLKCKGCWAAEYGHQQSLTFEEMQDIVTQGKALGTHFYMLTGGEPLIRKKDVIRLCAENQDCAFLAYTNGTLVDKAFTDEMKRVGNLALALSLEGTEQTTDDRRGDGIYDQVMNAMDLLHANKCLFGVSICYTRQNMESVTSDEFFDQIIQKGCKFALYFHYMPVGKGASTEMMPTPQQREMIYRRIRELRSTEHGKPIFTMDFQNDGEFVGGCIAGGRNYFHVNSAGDIEPCVFIHYADSNIRKDTLLEALQKPLFQAYYRNQPFNDNMLRPCPMLENPKMLREMVQRTGAQSTDLMEKESAEELCSKCDLYAQHWAPEAKRLWEKEKHFHPFTQYYRDTPEAKEEAARKKEQK